MPLFYKYAGENGIRILQDLRVKVTPPNEFNDPFEITPRSQMTLTVEEIVRKGEKDPEYYRDVFESMKAEGYPHSFSEFTASLPTIVPSLFPRIRGLMQKELMKADLNSLNEASKHLGIMCLSGTGCSIPMWSHYANHHRGIAIGFDRSVIATNIPGEFAKVRYYKHRVRSDPWLTPVSPKWQKQMSKIILMKSKDWEYEQEYRRIFYLNDLISIPPEKDRGTCYFLNISGTSIREIILGCCISEDLENRIRTEFSRRPKTFGHVRVYCCKRHPTKFELTIGRADPQ